MIEAGTRLAASPRQISTRLEGEAVILDTTDGVYYGLDRVGARVWELLQEATTPAEISAVLIEEYEVEPERLERDVLALVTDLEAAGLVEVQA